MLVKYLHNYILFSFFMKQLFFQGMSKLSRLRPGSKAFGKYERLRSSRLATLTFLAVTEEYINSPTYGFRNI